MREPGSGYEISRSVSRRSCRRRPPNPLMQPTNAGGAVLHPCPALQVATKDHRLSQVVCSHSLASTITINCERALAQWGTCALCRHVDMPHPYSSWASSCSRRRTHLGNSPRTPTSRPLTVQRLHSPRPHGVTAFGTAEDPQLAHRRLTTAAQSRQPSGAYVPPGGLPETS